MDLIMISNKVKNLSIAIIIFAFIWMVICLLMSLGFSEINAEINDYGGFGAIADNNFATSQTGNSLGSNLGGSDIYSDQSLGVYDDQNLDNLYQEDTSLAREAVASIYSSVMNGLMAFFIIATIAMFLTFVFSIANVILLKHPDKLILVKIFGICNIVFSVISINIVTTILTIIALVKINKLPC